MKYLTDYMEERQTIAFEKARSFFAFSDKQVEEGLSKYPGLTRDDVVSMGQGLVCERTQADWLFKELDKIYNDSIKQDIQENTLEGIVLRELGNHEAYYTGDIDSTWDAVENYPGLTRDIVYKLFRNKKFKILSDAENN